MTIGISVIVFRIAENPGCLVVFKDFRFEYRLGEPALSSIGDRSHDLIGDDRGISIFQFGVEGHLVF